MEERFAAALEGGGLENLLNLCQQVSRNITVELSVCKDDREPLSQSVTHHVACWAADSNCLTALIRQLGTDCLTDRNQFGDTPVHSAARHQTDGWLRLIQFSLGGADCFLWLGRHGQTVVHSAALNAKDNSALKYLASLCGRDCLVAVDQLGNTPVHLAAFKQGPDSMDLIKRSLGAACFLQPGQFERTPVHWAAMNPAGSSTLRWLVKQLGADCLRQPTSFGNTPVHLAAWKQGAESMKLMKAELGLACFSWRGQCARSVVHKAALNSVNSSALRWLAKELGADCLTEKDAQGNTAVHLAAWKQGKSLLSFIAKMVGAEAFRQRGNFGWTAAHMAAQNRCGLEGRHSALAWCVSELGRDCLLDKDSWGRTPAHLAARHMSVLTLSFIKETLGFEAFDELKDKDGRTVADYAASCEDDKGLKQRWIETQRKQLSDSD